MIGREEFELRETSVIGLECGEGGEVVFVWGVFGWWWRWRWRHNVVWIMAHDETIETKRYTSNFNIFLGSKLVARLYMDRGLNGEMAPAERGD